MDDPTGNGITSALRSVAGRRNIAVAPPMQKPPCSLELDTDTNETSAITVPPCSKELNTDTRPDTDTGETAAAIVGQLDALLLKRLADLETSLLKQLRGAAAASGSETAEPVDSWDNSLDPAMMNSDSNKLSVSDVRTKASMFYAHKNSSASAEGTMDFLQFERLVKQSEAVHAHAASAASGRRGSLTGRRSSEMSILGGLGLGGAVVEEPTFPLDSGVKMISAKVVHKLIHTHMPGFELENLNEAVKFAVGDPSKVCTTPDGQVAIDVDAFLQLKSDKVISRARRGIKRDLSLIHQALHTEMQQALYEDDGHDDWDNKLAPPEAKYMIKGPAATVLQIVPAIMISIQAAVFGISADHEPNSDAWAIADLAFNVFYFVEAAAKLYLMTIVGYFVGPERYWNWLDMSCIIMAAVDIIIMYGVEMDAEDLQNIVLLRMLRLFRLARLIKTLRLPIFKELHLMLMGLISGIQVLLWAVVMLVAFIYVIALVLNKLLFQEPEFNSVISTMATLFRCFTDGCTDYNGAPLPERLMRDHGAPIFVAYSLAYILVAVGVFNLFTALFIDNVTTSQAARKQQDLSDTSDGVEIAVKEALLKLVLQTRASGLPTELEEEIKSLDAVFAHRDARVRAQFQALHDEGIQIGEDQFSVWLRDEHFLDALEKAEVDIHNKKALFEVLDCDLGGSLEIEEIFKGLMKLRGPVTKNDIIAIRLKVRHLTQLLSHAPPDADTEI